MHGLGCLYRWRLTEHVALSDLMSERVFLGFD